MKYEAREVNVNLKLSPITHDMQSLVEQGADTSDDLELRACDFLQERAMIRSSGDDYFQHDG